MANYTPVVQMNKSGSAIRGARVQPDAADPSSVFDVRARVVVNATGVWADDVRALDESTQPKSIRPVGGRHRRRGAVEQQLLELGNRRDLSADLGRLFGLAWRRQ